jgi:hypothetical protein
MQSLEISKIQLVPIIFNLVILDIVGLEHATAACNTQIQTDHSLDVVETGRAPNAESLESDADWHKVKSKIEILAPSTAVESQTMDFVQEIKGLTRLNCALQPAVRKNAKVKNKRPMVLISSFLQPVLFLLVIMLTCLYL